MCLCGCRCGTLCCNDRLQPSGRNRFDSFRFRTFDKYLFRFGSIFLNHDHLDAASAPRHKDVATRRKRPPDHKASAAEPSGRGAGVRCFFVRKDIMIIRKAPAVGGGARDGRRVQSKAAAVPHVTCWSPHRVLIPIRVLKSMFCRNPPFSQIHSNSTIAR